MHVDKFRDGLVAERAVRAQPVESYVFRRIGNSGFVEPRDYGFAAPEIINVICVKSTGGKNTGRLFRQSKRLRRDFTTFRAGTYILASVTNPPFSLSL